MKTILERTPLSFLLSLLLGAAGLHAAPIQVNNFSFENPILAPGVWTNDLLDPAFSTADPQWTGRAGNGNGDTFMENISGFHTEGNQHLGMANGYFVFQNLGVPYGANTTYKLTVSVGYRNPTQSGTLSTTVIGLTALDEPPSDTNVLVGANTNDQLALDELLTASSASVDSVALNDGSQTNQHKFTDVTTQYTTGATPPVGNIVVFIGDDLDGVRSHFDNVRLEAVSALDPDEDGIPAEWETGTDRGVPRNLDPNVNDGGMDFDGDTLTNFMEFEKGTHPRLADTDADGINDSAETATNPLNPDSDGDTLLDGAEVAAGTNPNDTDSDDDNFEDQAETASGTNPLAGASKPSNNGEILLGVNFEGGNATSNGAQVTTQAGKFLQANWNNAPGGFGGPVSPVNSAGAQSIMRVSWKTNGLSIVGAEPPADDGNARLMHGILRPRGTAAVPGGDDIITEITVRNIAYPTFDLYLYLNAETGGQAIFTANDETTTVSNILTHGGSFVEVAGDGGEGNVLRFANLTGPTLTITQTMESGGIAGLQIVRGTTDTEGDGMPDLWEDAYGTNKTQNDAAADPDVDGLTNLQEYQRLTDPQNPDSDADTLKDGVETGTGTFASPTNTGTNPSRADTDGDGLGDGIENNSGTFGDPNNPGTNPTKADTDGDGFGDGEEVIAGSSPVSAASTPPIPAPIGYWAFDDQNPTATDDLSAGGNDGMLLGGATYAAGHTGNAGDFAIQLNGTDAAVTAGVSLLNTLDAFTISGWVNFDVDQNARTALFGQNDVVEFAMADLDTMELWTPTGAVMNPPFGPSSNGWRHLFVVADATGRRIYIDGVLAMSGAVGTPTASSGDFFNIGYAVPDAAGNYFNGMMDDVAVWDSALSDIFIGQLASGAFTPLGPAAPSTPIAITSFSYNPATTVLNLTFTSAAGSNYALEYSTGFLPAGAPTSALKWNVVPGYASIAGSAGTTSITPLTTSTLVTPGGQLPDNSQSYFRIRRP